MRHGEYHGARITTHQAVIWNSDPRYAGDQRNSAVKIKLGAVLVAEFRQVRNPAFHRRFFALLNLGFEYWEPTGGAISANERKLVNGYAKFLAAYGGNESALLDAAEQYLEQIANRRVTNGISLCKSFDAYRAWVTVEAGHYDAIQLPDGTLRKHPRSIAFSSMDEVEFQQLYKSALDVLWRWILSRTFRTQREAENAAAQLMSWAG
ncbi:hypothetical protein STU288_09495 [Salmonella enterica subsp. enterica serovar Typhimurium str. U288]|nr:hypothetical protein STU288_09495 [Salmonella enterica subsp. enterica serovar Typhimurium str. U288]